jgi:hypothetical protein
MRDFTGSSLVDFLSVFSFGLDFIWFLLYRLYRSLLVYSGPPRLARHFAR